MSFKIGIHYPARPALVTPYLTAFEKGIRKHGVNIEAQPFPNLITCDLAICWNHRNFKLFNAQKQNNADYLIMERGYIGNRITYTSLGFNGLNGKADFSYAKGLSFDRFESRFSDIFVDINKTDNDYVLLIGQVAGDASIAHISIRDWERTMVPQLKTIFKKEVVYRPHPVEIERKQATPVPGTTLSKNDFLYDDLKNALCCVTYNSTTGVQSVLANVPTFSFDKGSMAYSVSQHELINRFEVFDRKKWAGELSWKQFSIDELANGFAWDTVRRQYEMGK